MDISLKTSVVDGCSITVVIPYRPCIATFPIQQTFLKFMKSFIAVIEPNIKCPTSDATKVHGDVH